LLQLDPRPLLREGFGRLPRANMAFELGLAAAAPRARWFVFEQKPHRLVRSLSDVNGHDALIHEGRAENVVIKLREVFRTHRTPPTAPQLKALLGDVNRLAERIEAEQRTILGRQSFQDLVSAATASAERRGLI
jgi:hypothetical protein